MKNKELQIFENPEFGRVRTVSVDNEPWFFAKDVCDALSVATNHVRESLDEDEVSNLRSTEIGPEFGGKAPLIVSEAGLYSLILKSRKPEAKAFKRWITHDVIPAIRKTGGYSMKQKAQAEQDKTREMRAEAMLRNSISKQAKMMMEIAKMSHIKAYQDVMMAKAGNILAGENILPMPKSGRERRPLGWFCKQIGKAETWGTQLGKLLKRNGITQRPGENGEFVEDCARNNPHKHVQNFEWYVDYLLPIVQRDFMN